MGDRQELRLVLDHLQDVVFFMKDRQHRFVAVGMGQHRGIELGTELGTEHELLGRTDADIYPAHVAERIWADDRRVMESDTPLIGIVELLVCPQRGIDWYVTNKFPVHDREGRVIGVMGTVQTYEGRRRLLLGDVRLDEVIEAVRREPGGRHSIAAMAHAAGMSERQLGRRFRELLGMSPREFILRTRMKLACERLSRTQMQIAEIAAECGFYDQSAFSAQFRRTLGTSPLEYRRRYQTRG